MVTGIIELIPVLVEIGLKACQFIGKQKKENGRSELESILGRAKSILSAMEPLMERKNELVNEAGKEDLKKLIERVEEGNELVLGIRRSKKDKKQVQRWMESFKDSLECATFGVCKEMASDVKQLKHQATTQRQIHIHLCRNRQPPLTEEHCPSIASEEFFHHVSDFGGLESLFQGLRTVVNNKAEELKESVQLLTEEDSKGKELEPVSIDNEEELKLESVPLLTEEYNKGKEHEFVSVDQTKERKDQSKRRRIQPSAEEDKNEKDLESVRTNKMGKLPKKDIKKVVFAVLARDDAGKRIVEKSAKCMAGVIHAEREERPNQETDLVTVIGTKDLDVDYLREHLKRKLVRKRVDIVSLSIWNGR